MNYAKHALAYGILWSIAGGHAAAAEPKLEIRKFQLAYDSIEVLDAEGNNVKRTGAPHEAKIDDPAFLLDRSRRPVIHWTLPLRQAGRYTLRLTVVDQMAGNQARLELPLEVLDPSEPGTLAAN